MIALADISFTISRVLPRYDIHEAHDDIISTKASFGLGMDLVQFPNEGSSWDRETFYSWFKPCNCRRIDTFCYAKVIHT